MGLLRPSKPDTGSLDAKRQFDFWLGEWDATWGDGEHGTNSVYRDFDGHVIVENFDGRPATEFQGMSISVYDVKDGVWRQTWVDNEGNYLDFVGGFADGCMDLRRRTPEGLFRMLWSDIGRDAFDWRWQRSADDGETWETLWEIGYTRVL